jgi:putative addiction module component (TIGR02574 family)
MQNAIDLKQMSLPEKLQLMEALWDELCRQDQEVPFPEWQKEVLDQRERRVASGEATHSEWEAAKARIADKIKNK